MLFLAFPIYKSSWRPRNIFCRQQNYSCLCISLVESSFRVCGTFARLTICNEAVITSNNPAQQTQPDYYYTVVQWSWKGILEYYTNFNTNFSCSCSKKKGLLELPSKCGMKTDFFEYSFLALIGFLELFWTEILVFSKAAESDWRFPMFNLISSNKRVFKESIYQAELGRMSQ